MWTAGRFWQVLVTVAAIAAFAVLFAPADRWGGVDMGATGAAVFYLSLAGVIAWLSLKPHEVFPEDWSLAERRGWLATFASTLIVLTFAKYLWVLAQMDPVPYQVAELPARRLIGFIIVLAIAWGVCSRLLARGAGVVAEDERDLRIRIAADRAGDLALSLAAVGAVILLASVPAPQLGWWLHPLVLANVLIAVLIARTLIENLSLITLYARARR
jgi:hypothetical protein